MHRRKETNRSQSFVERALRVIDRIFARRIQHEETDEPIGIERDGFRDGIGIAGQTRHQRGAIDAVPIELAHPSHAELFSRVRKFPAEVGDGVSIGAEAGEESRRKEMDVRVADHAAWPDSR